MSEIWKAITGYEGFYQASSRGRVKSLGRKGCRRDRILKPGLDSPGYRTVRLYDAYGPKTHKVSKLMAMTFLKHKPDGTQKIVVDHIDNNKTNDRLDNLQLISQRQNASKDLKGGTSKFTGVCWDAQRKKWMAQIQINGERKNLGRFHDEKEAGQTYQNALKKTKEICQKMLV